MSSQLKVLLQIDVMPNKTPPSWEGTRASPVTGFCSLELPVTVKCAPVTDEHSAVSNARRFSVVWDRPLYIFMCTFRCQRLQDSLFFLFCFEWWHEELVTYFSLRVVPVVGWFCHNMPSNHDHCCVPGCTADRRYSPGDRIRLFHKFPENLDLRKKWIDAIRRDEVEGVFSVKDSTVVCSDHFLAENYVQKEKVKGARHVVGTVPSVFDLESWPKYARTTAVEAAKTPRRSVVRAKTHCQTETPNAVEHTAATLEEAFDHMRDDLARCEEELALIRQNSFGLNRFKSSPQKNDILHWLWLLWILCSLCKVSGFRGRNVCPVTPEQRRFRAGEGGRWWTAYGTLSDWAVFYDADQATPRHWWSHACWSVLCQSVHSQQGASSNDQLPIPPLRFHTYLADGG